MGLSAPRKNKPIAKAVNVTDNKVEVASANDCTRSYSNGGHGCTIAYTVMCRNQDEGERHAFDD